MLDDDMKRVHLEFHVSRSARDRYQFDEMLFGLTGNVVFANFHAARLFAQKINERRDLINNPEQAARAGQINAMGLIDEVLHRVIATYREQQNPNVMADALQSLESTFGATPVAQTLQRFVDEFPPLAVYRRQQTIDDYLAGQTDQTPNRELVLEEMLMLWLTNLNPAFAPFQELFDDAVLEKETIYPKIFDHLYQFFEGQPKWSVGGDGGDGGPGATSTGPAAGRGRQNLIDILRAPALASPHSLSGQLQFLQQRFGVVLGRLLYRVLGSMDLIKEEEKAVFVGGGPGPVEIVEFGGMEVEPEQFSPDREWMPRLVLIARNAYVWLDQLSKRYQQSIATLADIPDSELDTLAQAGITGLWLIGLWERSTASKTIKQLCGNPDAVASAYSLLNYNIASDLGGEPAYQNLRDRAWQRGIRLASDMVPNHMGIDSDWVMEHPDWFISLGYSPFPSYTFNGPDLSPRSDVGIYLEDHYFDRTDAAVVFKRVDRHSGSERYIYHGNDGTSMPWNDTAQLNYLMAEVREAVIQTILHVARQFPIIRFDAAMTLAKRHVQRLWFPEPGTGGAIASRSDYGLPKQQFDALMPAEFWRDVVDRAAVEVPDTLLLAEAFWMMEGYFVRTLGMHRVYNSAFMNLLRDEDNSRYRTVMKNTLEFDPEILKRYVNFMNNPDERTAVDQFGKGDKYFGICTLMATMPGLPMFGHGQIEGFTEKYGMEYRRAYWEEQPDHYLVQRHEREIFPLLHRRYLFSGVDHFLLYDFFTSDGVNEDVFAYSNQAGDERSLIVCHNRFGTARGWIRSSVAYSARVGDGEERALVHKTLGEGLGLRGGDQDYLIFSDHATGLEYIRNSKELVEKGLYLELEAYTYHVFLDLREVHDNEWQHYRHLAAYLGGQGVPSIDEALRETFLRPIHQSFRDLVNAGMIQRLIDERSSLNAAEPSAELLAQVEDKALTLLREARQFVEGSGDEQEIARELRTRLVALLQLSGDEAQTDDTAAVEQDELWLPNDPATWGTLLSWLFTQALGKVTGEDGYEQQSRTWIDEWLLGKIIAGTLQDLGLDQGQAARSVMLVKLLTSHQGWSSMEPGTNQACTVLEGWLKDEAVQQFLGVNRHQGVLWFNKESFGELLWWMQLMHALQPVVATEDATDGAAQANKTVLARLRAAEATSEYRVDRLLSAATDAPVAETAMEATRAAATPRPESAG